ncbi:MAG: FIST N-terminal domain-containing protein [Myxococcota bacterium]
MTLRTSSALAESPSEVTSAAKMLGTALGDAPGLVMFFASSGYELGAVVDSIKRIYPDAMVLGSSSAGEFTERGDAKNSVSMFGIAGDLETRAAMAFHLEQDVERAVASATTAVPRQMDGYPYRTALLFLDPLSGRSEEATALAASYLGNDVTLAGGASGDDLRMHQTQVSLDHLVASNAMALVVLYTRTPVGIGVSHRNRVLSQPMQVTRAVGSTVYEVDGRPAWDVWLDAAGYGLEFPSSFDGFGSQEITRFLLTHEAALYRGEELRVRAPLTRRANGALGFACGIPEGSRISVAESSAEAQVQSALDAARQARDALNGAPVSGALVFDCVSRNLLLGNRFDEAVRGISHELGSVPIAGFESYGEIGSRRGFPADFHNTSTVVVAFGC